MSAVSMDQEACIDFMIFFKERIRNIQTWLENEEHTFRHLLSPLQSSRVGKSEPSTIEWL